MKSPKLLLTLALALALVLNSTAQQGNIWYFGAKAGLDFNSGAPVPIFNGELSTYEGCASICDNSGNLLFYTDGSTVWNKFHQIMLNGTGLMGNSSSTQSGVIVPFPTWPCNDSMYYVVTVDNFQNNGTRGYNYSVVNLKANGGKGEVTKKNVSLFAPCTEKIAAARAANGVDWWVITKEWNTNGFRSYLITDTGFSSVPVISNVGPVVSGSTAMMAGCMRSSPDGSKLALATGSFAGTGSRGELYDFDIATGKVSNPTIFNQLNPYGVEFSPDSKFLYISYEPYQPLPMAKIMQYDVTKTNSADIIASATLISPTTDPNFFQPCGMQIGPDGKIYVVKEDEMFMDVIEFPNKKGAASGYKTNAINLQRRSGMMPPNIISSFLAPIKSLITPTINYITRDIDFTTPTNPYFVDVKYKWLFGDGTTSTQQNPSHAYPHDVDTFTVILIVTAEKNTPCVGKENISDTSSIVIILDPKPNARYVYEEQCGDKTVKFTDSSTTRAGIIASYYWDFGNGKTSTLKSPVHTFDKYGTYIVKMVAKSPKGVPSDTIKKTIIVRSKPVADLTTINGCRDQSLTFKDQSIIDPVDNIVKWSWILGDGSTEITKDVQHSYTSAKQYTVQHAVVSDKGCYSDTVSKTVVIEDYPVPAFDITGGCVGRDISFKDKSTVSFGTIAGWDWKYGNGDAATDQNPVYQYNNFGDYIVSFSAKTINGCASPVITKPLRVEAIPVISFDNSPACWKEEISFTNLSSLAFGDIAGYQWDFGNGNKSNLFEPKQTYNTIGSYTISLQAITKNGCSPAPFTKTFNIYDFKVFAGNDTIIAMGQPLHLNAVSVGGIDHVWSPSIGLNSPFLKDPVAILNRPQSYSVSVKNAEGCYAFDNISIKVYKGPDIYVPSAFSPNNNGSNDEFKLVAAGVEKLYFFRVHNRWGNLVFETTDVRKGWDGKFKGQMQPPGMYVWSLHAVDYLGNPITKKGTVMLLR